MRVAVTGIGVLGVGLDGWAATRAVLRGEAPYSAVAMRNPAPAIMPAAERRRASLAIRLALEVANQAVIDAGSEPATLASVFACCDGDGDTINAVCAAITEPGYPVSPTKFTNSVHNAAAGYWGIAVAAREPSTSLCAWEGSAFAGLAEAAVQVIVEARPVLLVVSDAPLPEPLARFHPSSSSFGCALVLVPAENVTAAHAWLEIAPYVNHASNANNSRDTADAIWPASLPTALGTNPAAALVPLLAAIARGDSAPLRCGDLTLRVSA